MAGKKVNIMVDLDFTADNMSIDRIRDQMDLAFKAMKVNLDPASYKKAEAQLKELAKMAERSFNKSTNTMNFKALEKNLASSNIIGSLDHLDRSLIEMGVNGTKSINAIKVANDYLEKSLVGSNNVLTKMGTTLMNTIRWNISTSAVNAVTGEFQRAYNFSKDLDRSLTNIRIVSGLSADNMARFAVEANKSAQALKVSTIDYAEASLVFYQQGLEALEVKKMTEASIIGANITGESTEEMSTLLTSVVNGYRIAAQDVFTVTDKLAAVGATTASDFYELATAMSKVASMANAAGVPIDELNAQIATIVSVTKESPESIGTSLKTIYGRMLAFKADTKALMKDEDGETFGAPNVEAALKAYNKATGAQISLFKTTKDGKQELRDLSKVLEEVGDSWGNTEDKVAKFGLATALAGSRQQNRLVALFDSWDMYKDAVETSLQAEGTSMRQNEIYMDSYQGKLKGLQAAKEEMYISFTDSEGLKSFIEGLTSAVQLMSKLSEHTGNLGGVLGVLGAIMAKPAMNMLGKMPNITSGAGTSAATGVNERLDAEIANREKLMVINKAYGAEEANRIRTALQGATEEHLAHKRKSDNLSQEADMIEQIGIVMKMKNEASKKDRMDEIIEENAGLESTKFNVQQVEQAYNDVASAQQTLNALLLEAPTEKTKAELYKAVEEAEVELDKAQAKVEEIKASVGILRDGSYTSARKADVAGDKAEIEQKKLDDAAKAGEKVIKQTQAIQAGMLLILPTLSMAKDSTNSWAQVLSTIPKMMLPMLPTIAKGLGEVKKATADVTGVAAKLGAAMTTSLAPIAWAAVAAAALGTVMHFAAKAANEYKDAVAEVETASGALEAEKQEYESIGNEITEITEKLRELKDLQKEGADHSEEITALTTRKELLEQEKIIQEFNLKLAREKAEAAALEAAQAKITSEYIHTSGSGYSGYGGYGGRRNDGDRVTVVQELEAVNASYKANSDSVKKLTGDLAKMSEAGKESTDEWKEVDAALTAAREARDKDKEAIAKHSASVIENNKHLGTSTEEERKYKAEAEAVLKVTTELMESTKDEAFAVQGSTEAYNEHIIAVEAAEQAKTALEEKMDDLSKQFNDATSSIQTFNGFLNEMTTKEGLSAKSKQELITKYHELLPYIDNEKELRIQLIEIIKREEEVQWQAYANMIMISEDFFNAKVKGNKDLVDKLGEYYDKDLENAKSLADAKAMVEERLIQNIAKQWAKFYQVSAIAGEGYVQTMGQGGMIDEFGQNMAKNMVNEMQKVSGLFDDIVVEFGTPDFKDINMANVKDSEKDKDNQQFLESIDAEIRAIKLRNDHLFKTSNLLKEQLDLAKDIEGIEGLNEQYRLTGELIAHNEEIIESFKEEQGLVHIEAEKLRKTYSQYDTHSWFDANGEQTLDYIDQYNSATEDQKKEMAQVFGWVQKLKQAWADANGEVKNVLNTNKELGNEISKHPGKVRDYVRELIELEKRNANMDLERRQREANNLLELERQDMQDKVDSKQEEIDDIQDEIDRIQEGERLRQENLERSKRLSEISKLQDRYYHLQYKDLATLTEEQAKSLGLEKEREQYLERQTKLQELLIRLENVKNEKNIQQLKKLEDGTWEFEYVADQKEIDDINKQVEDLQKEHSDTIKNLKEQTLDDLSEAQESYDEWERDNGIQQYIRIRQQTIKNNQQDIKDLQDKFTKLKEQTDEGFRIEKENLDRKYQDIDLLTDKAMKDLDKTFGDNWDTIGKTLKGKFEIIAEEYRKLIEELSKPIPTPSGGQGLYASPSDSPDYGKGVATGQAATDNENRLTDADRHNIGIYEQNIAQARASGNRDMEKKFQDALDEYKNSIASRHQGGIVGDGSRDLPETVNKLFNLKPNEQIVKALKGELFIPEENIFKNFLPNMQNLLNMAAPNITLPKLPNVATASGGDTIYYIDELNVPTNDFQSFIRDFTSVVENHPNKTIMKAKKIGGLK